MPGPEGLLLVTLTDRRVNVGLARLEMQQAVEELG
jgi:predicted regulator of Ras-like GTPase activity (Roadblock/LC7/MglB family)